MFVVAALVFTILAMMFPLLKLRRRRQSTLPIRPSVVFLPSAEEERQWRVQPKKARSVTASEAYAAALCQRQADAHTARRREGIDFLREMCTTAATGSCTTRAIQMWLMVRPEWHRKNACVTIADDEISRTFEAMQSANELEPPQTLPPPTTSPPRSLVPTSLQLPPKTLPPPTTQALPTPLSPPASIQPTDSPLSSPTVPKPRAPVPHMSAAYARGDRVTYWDSQKQAYVAAKIVGVHRDEVPPFYTIDCDGVERQTEAARLKPATLPVTPPTPTPRAVQPPKRQPIEAGTPNTEAGRKQKGAFVPREAPPIRNLFEHHTPPIPTLPEHASAHSGTHAANIALGTAFNTAAQSNAQ